MNDYYPDSITSADYYPDTERSPIPMSGCHDDGTPCYGTGGCDYPRSCVY